MLRGSHCRFQGSSGTDSCLFRSDDIHARDCRLSYRSHGKSILHIRVSTITFGANASRLRKYASRTAFPKSLCLRMNARVPAFLFLLHFFIICVLLIRPQKRVQQPTGGRDNNKCDRGGSGGTGHPCELYTSEGRFQIQGAYTDSLRGPLRRQITPTT